MMLPIAKEPLQHSFIISPTASYIEQCAKRIAQPESSLYATLELQVYHSNIAQARTMILQLLHPRIIRRYCSALAVNTKAQAYGICSSLEQVEKLAQCISTQNQHYSTPIANFRIGTPQELQKNIIELVEIAREEFYPITSVILHNQATQ